MHHAEGVEHAACIDDVEQPPPRKEDRYAGMAVAANEAGRWDVRYAALAREFMLRVKKL